MKRITVKGLQAELVEARAWLTAALDEITRLKQENAAMHVAQRPSREARSALRKGFVPTNEQREAHRAYVEKLSEARELAIRTGKSVTVERI